MRVFSRLVWVMTMGLAGGCAPFGAQVVDSGAPLPVGEDSAAFIDRVASQPTVSEDDAMRGMLMLLDGEDTAQSFDERVRKLLDKQIIRANWGDCAATRPITRAKLAHMAFQACAIPGGVILTLTGPSPRYCLREMQYRKMMAPGAGRAPVTGMEYVAVLTRADLCRRTGKVPDLLGQTEADEAP